MIVGPTAAPPAIVLPQPDAGVVLLAAEAGAEVLRRAGFEVDSVLERMRAALVELRDSSVSAPDVAAPVRGKVCGNGDAPRDVAARTDEPTTAEPYEREGTTAEVLAMTGVPETTVRYHARSGSVRARKVRAGKDDTGGWRIDLDDVPRWLTAIGRT